MSKTLGSREWVYLPGYGFKIRRGWLGIPAGSLTGNKCADGMQDFSMSDEEMEALRDAIDAYMAQRVTDDQIEQYEENRRREFEAQLTEEIKTIREKGVPELQKKRRTIDDA